MASKMKKHHLALQPHRVTVTTIQMLKDDGDSSDGKELLPVTPEQHSTHAFLSYGSRTDLPFMSLDCTFGSGRVEGDPCTSFLKRALFSKSTKSVP